MRDSSTVVHSSSPRERERRLLHASVWPVRVALRGALLTLAALSVTMGMAGCGCSDAPCGVSVSMEGAVPNFGARSVSFRVCLNDECVDIVLDTSTRTGTGESAILRPDPTPGDDNLDGVYVKVTWTDLPARAVLLYVESYGLPALRDGDRYVVDVTDPTTGEVVNLLDRVVTYTVTEPNGERCGPTCKNAQLTW